MSTLFNSEYLDKDYILFEKGLFNTNEIKYTLTNELKTHLKKYHKLTYIIALFDIKLEHKWTSEQNKFLFISEIRSDLLSNSAISILGFYNSSKILTRRFIENFYNHIYYFDHPIEYQLLNLGRNEYTPMLDLKRYYSAHPVIVPQAEKDGNIKLFNDDLFNQYHELCKHVHTKGVEFMGLAKNLTEIMPQIDIVSHFEQINKSTLVMVYLLFKFHADIIFTPVEKTIITSVFDKPMRKALVS